MEDGKPVILRQFIFCLCFVLWSTAGYAEGELHLDGQPVSYDLNPYLRRLRFLSDNQADKMTNRFDLSQRRGTQWLQFSVVNDATAAADWVLSTAFPLKSMIVLNKIGLQEVGRTGAAIALKDKMPSLAQAVTLHISPGRSTYYVGVDVDGNPFLSLFRIEPLAAFKASQRDNFLVFAFSIGGSLSLILYNILYFLSLRKRQFLFYCLLIASYMCLETIITGLPLLLDPPYSHMLGDTWIIWDVLCMIGMTLFSTEYFATKLKYPRYHRFVLGFIAFSLVVLALYPLKNPAVGAVYVATECTIYISILWVAFSEARRRNAAALTYLMAFVPSLVILLLFMAQILDVITTNISLNKVRFIAVIFWGIMFSVGYSTVIDHIKTAHATLRRSLAGLLPETQIENMLRKGRLYNGAPITKPMTILFIDIVGYSKTIKYLAPESAFYFLKRTMTEITTAIHQHGGIIDRSLGDGVISFFGYDLLEQTTEHHAYRAIMAAAAIQKSSVATILAQGLRHGEPIFPLRIGIHSGPVCVGNLGDESRYDVSLAGAGVFLARKFEACCDPHKLIISTSTYALLSADQRQSGAISKKLVPIGSSGDLAEAYEYDPFFDTPDLLTKARAIFRQKLAETARDQRISAPHLETAFASPFGAMPLVNFALGGFCLQSPVLLARGATFELGLPPSLLPTLPGRTAATLKVEVMWSLADKRDHAYVGVKISELNAEDKSILFNNLQRHFGINSDLKMA